MKDYKLLCMKGWTQKGGEGCPPVGMLPRALQNLETATTHLRLRETAFKLFPLPLAQCIFNMGHLASLISWWFIFQQLQQIMSRCARLVAPWKVVLVADGACYAEWNQITIDLFILLETACTQKWGYEWNSSCIAAQGELCAHRTIENETMEEKYSKPSEILVVMEPRQTSQGNTNGC